MDKDVPRRFTSPMSVVFAYPTRIWILGVLMEGETPMSASDIIEYADIARPTFYDHCDEMVELGLLTREPKDKTVEYELADTEAVELILRLNEVFDRLLRETDDDRLETLVSELYY